MLVLPPVGFVVAVVTVVSLLVVVVVDRVVVGSEYRALVLGEVVFCWMIVTVLGDMLVERLSGAVVEPMRVVLIVLENRTKTVVVGMNMRTKQKKPSPAKRTLFRRIFSYLSQISTGL